MSLLKTVSKGIIKKPHYILMHGLPGLGKSSFAAGSLDPIYLCAEKGTNHLDVSRLELNDFDGFLKAIAELRDTKHDYKTVVIDTIDHVEPLIFKEVCKDKSKNTIEDIGYAKGYEFALDYWSKLINGLEELRENGMNIILLAHTFVKTFNDPQLAEGYDRYQVKLHHKASSLIIDRVECVLFANYETFLKTGDNEKTKAFGDGARVIYTEHRPAAVAKNRFNLPYKLPLDWEAFATACDTEKSSDPKDLQENIQSLLSELKNEDVKKKVQEHLKKIGNDAKELAAVENKLKTMVAA